VTTANKAGAWRRAKDILYLIGVNLAVFVALFVVFELAVHIVYHDQNPWLRPPFVKSRIRVANPIYGHGLVPNFDGEEVWGNDKSHVVTNSFGFKDASMRQVPLQSTKTRVLFLGDSFTEGLGMPYEQTFVGLFAAAFPQLDILNAAAASYAPTIYYAKAKYLIEAGLQVDEVIVYIDISDMQDEAITYRTDKEGKVVEGDFDVKCPAPPQMIRLQSPWWAHFSYVLDVLHKRYVLMSYRQTLPDADFASFSQPRRIYAKSFPRAAWTYDSSLPVTRISGSRERSPKQSHKWTSSTRFFPNVTSLCPSASIPGPNNSSTTRRSHARSPSGAIGAKGNAAGSSITFPCFLGIRVSTPILCMSCSSGETPTTPHWATKFLRET